MNGFAKYERVPTLASLQRASLIGRALLVKREVLSHGIA